MEKLREILNIYTIKRIVCGSNRKPNTEDAGLMKSLNIHSMQERERERERERVNNKKLNSK